VEVDPEGNMVYDHENNPDSYSDSGGPEEPGLAPEHIFRDVEPRECEQLGP
jgi:hypothetical protein